MFPYPFLTGIDKAVERKWRPHAAHPRINLLIDPRSRYGWRTLEQSRRCFILVVFLMFLENNHPASGPLQAIYRELKGVEPIPPDEFDRVTCYWSGPRERTLVGLGKTRLLVAAGENRFASLIQQARSLTEQISWNREKSSSLPDHHLPSPVLTGGGTFQRTRPDESEWHDFQPAWFILPRILLSYDGRTVKMIGVEEEKQVETLVTSFNRLEETFHANSPSSSVSSLPEITREEHLPTRTEWLRSTGKWIENMEEGSLQKIVPARRVSYRFNHAVDPKILLSRLLESQQNVYQFFLSPPDRKTAFLGGSPERLVTRENDGRVRSEPLAGTVPCGTDAAEESSRAESLLEDQKKSREHAIVVDYVRDQLDSFSEQLRESGPTIRTAPSVQHIHTKIEGRLEENTHILKLVDELHPTPAVGGVPVDTAVRELKTMEPFDRGLYAGPVGWFTPGGTGSFAIGIRSALCTDRKAHLYAGAGFVRGSDPEQEWREIELKFSPMQNVIGTHASTQ